MAKGGFVSTRYPGVFYKELASLDPHTGKPDRTFYYSAPDEFGKAHWIKVGRQSQGVTARIAAARKTKHEPAPSVVTEAKPFTFGEAVAAYEAYARANGKHIDPPLEQYVFHCKRHLHNTPIDAFTPEQAEALKGRLRKRNLAEQSVHHALSFLKRVCNYAIGTGHAKNNPFKVSAGGVFRMPTLNNRRERYLTPAECNRLLEALQKRSAQLWYMARLSLATGMRATEIFSLMWSDIDRTANCLYVRAKGGRREIVRATPETIAMLEDMPRIADSPYVFPLPDGRRRGDTPATFRRIVEDLGMQAPANSPQHISFHTFRHTFASLLAQSGTVTLHELQLLLRHRTIEMTLRYAHLIPSETAGKIGIIDDMLKEAQVRSGSC